MLSFESIRQIFLTKYNLRGLYTNANLSYATLTEANLTRANLGHAYLNYANLIEADLHEANLSYALQPHFAQQSISRVVTLSS